MTAFVMGTSPSPFGASGGRFTEISPRTDPGEALRHLERHGSYTHTGYPFMQLAKETGADYGDVLAIASPHNIPVDELVKASERLSGDVLRRIGKLTSLPVYLRGGNHYVRQDPHDD